MDRDRPKVAWTRLGPALALGLTLVCVVGLLWRTRVHGALFSDRRRLQSPFVQRQRVWSKPAALPVTAARLGQTAASAHLATTNRANFEGGNIGPIVRRGTAAVDLYLRSDNDDDLPREYRQWFYVKLTGLPRAGKTTVVLRRLGFDSYYLPYYSYDHRSWRPFAESEVQKTGPDTLTIEHAFDRDEVWLARYVPYTYTDLRRFLATLAGNGQVAIGTIGNSQQGQPIPLITIRSSGPDAAQRPWVMIHARTHPGEVGSSFFLEGLIKALTAPTAEAGRYRAVANFAIVPMLNVDGVVVGNNRTTPRSENLEGMWFLPGETPGPTPRDQAPASLALDPVRTPLEVKLLHRQMVALMGRGDLRMALNLHTSASKPEEQMFFYPHFGASQRHYSPAERRLWQAQSAFIGRLRSLAGARFVTPPRRDAGRDFLTKAMPEAWWWRNFRDQVLALTVETVYGRFGSTGRWVSPSDLERLGAEAAKAITESLGSREFMAQYANSKPKS